MDCKCTAITTTNKNILKVRKGNTLKLKLKYTINGTPATIESINKTRFFLINPYQIKREITNYNVPRNFDDEVEISLTEDVVGRYSIEMVYRENNTTQATYDFEDVFEIVGKSREETDLTDSEFINKEVSLNGYLRVGYDDEALDRRIGDLPNFAQMRSSMYILNSEVEKLKEQLSNVGNGCNCQESMRELDAKMEEIRSIDIYDLGKKINDRYINLEDKLNININTHYQELSNSIYNTNTRLEAILLKIKQIEDELKKKQTTSPTVSVVPIELIDPYMEVATPTISVVESYVDPVVPSATPTDGETPTPPNKNGGSESIYDITPNNPDYTDNQEDGLI